MGFITFWDSGNPNKNGSFMSSGCADDEQQIQGMTSWKQKKDAAQNNWVRKNPTIEFRFKFKEL